MAELASLVSPVESDLASKGFSVMTLWTDSNAVHVLQVMLVMDGLVREEEAAKVDLASQVRDSYN